jgi:WD40 repeat protein
VNSVAFEPGGHVLLTGSYGVAQRWNTESRELMEPVLQAKKPPVYAAQFSPDGSKIIIGGTEGSAQLWESKTGKLLGDFVGHTNEVYAVAFGPDGRTVLTGSHDNTAQLWDAESRKPLGEPFRHGGFVMSVAYSPDGHTVMTGSADHTVRLWNISDSGGRILRHEGDIRAAAFSQDGGAVLTGGDDNTARLWDARTGQPRGEPLRHAAPVKAVAIIADGATILTGSADRVQRWNAQTSQVSGDSWTCEGEIRDIVLSADGQSVLVHCVNEEEKSHWLELRDGLSGHLRAKPLRFDLGDVLLACSPDLETALVGQSTGQESGLADLWSIPGGRSTGKSLLHDSRIITAVYSRDGRVLATGGWDQQVRLWDAKTAAPGKSLQHNGIVNSVSISRDGATILSGGDNRMARLWDAKSGLALGTPLQHPAPVSKVALDPEGRIAVTISDGSAYLWDVFSSKRLARPLEYECAVQDCQFEPNGSEIQFRCADGTVRLYDIPKPLPDDPEFIHAWSRARSGFELGDTLEPRQLTQAEWLKSRERLSSLEESP